MSEKLTSLTLTSVIRSFLDRTVTVATGPLKTELFPLPLTLMSAMLFVDFFIVACFTEMSSGSRVVLAFPPGIEPGPAD